MYSQGQLIAPSSMFRGARFGSHADLTTPQWQECFRELENYSDRYLQELHRHGCWPVEYPWPADALHCNTRIWEYPFVFDAIQRFATPNGRVLDIGSALTFLPSFLASKGCVVVASDIDPRMQQWFANIILQIGRDRLPWPAANLTYEGLDITSTNVARHEFDVVTNISVLEHLPPLALAAATSAIYELLRPGGLFICTLDCWISGDRTEHHHPLDQQEFVAFSKQLEQQFEMVEAFEACVPSDLVTNRRYPHSVARDRARPTVNTAVRFKQWSKQIARAVLGRPQRPLVEWCVFGMIVRKPH